VLPISGLPLVDFVEMLVVLRLFKLLLLVFQHLVIGIEDRIVAGSTVDDVLCGLSGRLRLRVHPPDDVTGG